jgi:hypothetical protein
MKAYSRPASHNPRLKPEPHRKEKPRRPPGPRTVEPRAVTRTLVVYSRSARAPASRCRVPAVQMGQSGHIAGLFHYRVRSGSGFRYPIAHDNPGASCRRARCVKCADCEPYLGWGAPTNPGRCRHPPARHAVAPAGRRPASRRVRCRSGSRCGGIWHTSGTILPELPGHMADTVEAALRGEVLTAAQGISAVTVTRSLPHGHVAAAVAMPPSSGSRGCSAPPGHSTTSPWP